MVQAVLSHGAHPTLGDRVRLRGVHQGEYGLGTDRGEHVVEGRAELGVAVSDEELHPPAHLFEFCTEVACDLGHRKQLRRRFCNRGWRIAHHGVELTGASSVAVTRYRYRGANIPTPWTQADTTS